MWKENFLSHLIDVYKCDFAVRNRSETLELVLLYFPVFWRDAVRLRFTVQINPHLGCDIIGNPTT